jgi:hypothetical protein
MTLRPACVRLALCLPLAAAGCSTISPSRDSLFSRAAPASDIETEVVEAEEDEPRTSRVSRSRPEEPTFDAEPQDLAAALPSTGAAPHALDSATLMLIDQELRDLPPAERQRWQEYLKTLDPRTIPYVLQARRMEAAAHGPAAAAAPATIAQTTYASQTNHQLPQISPNNAPAQPFHAPQLSFDPGYDDPAHSASTPVAGHSPLSAPDPGAGPVPTGISPFDNRSHPTVPTSTAPAQAATTGAPYQSDAPPTIAPNGPVELPAAANQPLSPASPAGVNASPTGRIDYQAAAFDASQINPQVQPPRSVATLQNAYWQETLQRLTALVEAEVAASQPGLSEAERLAYVKRQVWLRMLYLMAEQPQLAQQAIPGVDPAEQEFWTELFWAVSNYFDEQSFPNPADRAALTVDQLASAQRQLEAIAPLQLRSVSFCHDINSFGNFDQYERDEFRAGQEVLLYAEVRNFRSEPAAAGGYGTRLKSHIEIRRGGPDGQPVEQNSFPSTEDTCRSIRHDYFHSYKIDLPQHLTPGPYALVLTVEDELSGKSATQTVNFLIR